jgi:hydrogenase expression/formation protein HypC
MCLGIPGRVIEIYEAGGLRMGKIDFGGAVRESCLEYVPDVKVDDYVIVHVGFAISVLSEEQAQETLELLNEVLDAQEISGEEPGSA